MRCRCSAWKFFLFLSALFAPALFLTACSGVSHSAGNMGGTSGGSGGGTGGSGLACNGMSVGQTASLNGFVPFSNTSLWNTDIASAPIDPNSNTMISNWVGSVNLHPDWGTDPTYGIPYVVVNGSQGLVNVNLGAYGNESDPGPMPVPASAPVEGGSSSTGDRHVLVLDNGNCFLYELYNSSVNSDGSWNTDSTAVWDCWATSNALTHGPPRTRLGYRFFLAWCVTMKPLQARYNMLSASLCLRPAPLSHRPRPIGRPLPVILRRRRWACVSA